MDFRLTFSVEFYNDLDCALDYITNTLDNPKYAYKLWEDVQEKAELINKSPYLFPIYHQIEAAAKMGFRKAIVNDYLLFFHINEELGIITIDSFIHSKRDFNEIFNTFQKILDNAE